MSNVTRRSAGAAPVTPEHYRHLRELGFFPVCDRQGRLSFIERDEYRQLVDSRELDPGTSVQ